MEGPLDQILFTKNVLQLRKRANFWVFFKTIFGQIASCIPLAPEGSEYDQMFPANTDEHATMYQLLANKHLFKKVKCNYYIPYKSA